ncbi:MAG TPA: tyrosine--tRNA ligase [Rhodospirillaceae bacterium]|nr:tyrosine--tRNA ligase [Rhodospirillaceae bacterium]
MATNYKSEFLRILDERGFIHQMTDAAALDAQLTKGQVTGYIGFDATASSLHVGNLVSIMLLRWLQKTGHKPIVVIGGGTTKAGDPSGRDEMRKLLSVEDIKNNAEGILQNFRQFIDFSNERAILVDNAEWLDKLNYIEFLRDVGPHFSVNRMLSFDSVKLRLDREQNLSFIEFNYMIMQAYDFVELKRRYDCTLQMGGSDQWGNIVNGTELWRRINAIGTAKIGEQRIGEIFGLTTPLITKSDGSKMGKSLSGAIWLSADKLSPYDYYQFWRNTNDADVGKMLSLFTELPMDEVRRLSVLKGAEINEAKKILAFEATKMCHGEDAARSAIETARNTFEHGALGDDLPIVRSSIGTAIVDLLVEAGFAASKGEAKRLIAGGGVKLNDEKVTDESAKLGAGDVASGEAKLSAGKKKHAIVTIAEEFGG